MSRLSLLALTLIIPACGKSPSDAGTGELSAIELVSGGNQVGTAGYPLDDSIVVRVVDQSGRPVSGIRLELETMAYSALVASPDTRTREDGTFRFSWTMGASRNGETVRVVDPERGLTALVVHAQGGSRPVKALVVGQTAAGCLIDMDGRFGCWVGWHDDPDPTTIYWLESSQSFVAAVSTEIVSLPDMKSRVCALATTGRVWCFGIDSKNHKVVFDAPVELAGDHPPFAQLFAVPVESWTSGPYCGLTAAGEAWCWGDNRRGTLGDGTKIDRESPVRVDTDKRFASLSLSELFSCGLALNGSAWCWGSNSRAQLGRTLDVVEELTPVEIPGGHKFLELATMGDGACGRSASEVLCWGASYSIGLSSSDPHSPIPIPVAGTNGALSVTTTRAMFAAILPGSRIIFWGEAFHAPGDGAPHIFDMLHPVTRAVPGSIDGEICTAGAQGDRWLCEMVHANHAWLRDIFWYRRQPSGTDMAYGLRGVPAQ